MRNVSNSVLNSSVICKKKSSSMSIYFVFFFFQYSCSPLTGSGQIGLTAAGRAEKKVL